MSAASHVHAPAAGFPLSSVTHAGKPLGSATALVDEDVLRILLLDAPGGEKTLQLRYDLMLGAALSGGAVMITARDGRTVLLATGDAVALRGRILAACRALPEVTRALRALGTRRGAHGSRLRAGDHEARFFAPLIAARRASMEARDAAAVIAAFTAQPLAAAIAATILHFAAERGADVPARRRAVEAELDDAAAPLSAALEDLALASRLAAADVDDLGRWREWAAAVQRTFEAADRAWPVIDSIVSRPW